MKFEEELQQINKIEASVHDANTDGEDLSNIVKHEIGGRCCDYEVAEHCHCDRCDCEVAEDYHCDRCDCEVAEDCHCDRCDEASKAVRDEDEEMATDSYYEFGSDEFIQYSDAEYVTPYHNTCDYSMITPDPEMLNNGNSSDNNHIAITTSS